MSNIREIVTKAVIGKGKRTITANYVIAPPEKATKVLGCWIINHQYGAFIVGDRVEVRGTYDIHLWHAYQQDHETAVVKRIIDYVEDIPLKIKPGDKLNEHTEIKAICTKYPTCTALEIAEDGQVRATVAKEFAVDAIGETKIKVQITQASDDEWFIDSEIDTSVNPQYISK